MDDKVVTLNKIVAGNANNEDIYLELESHFVKLANLVYSAMDTELHEEQNADGWYYVEEAYKYIDETIIPSGVLEYKSK
jgi:hypothetical protein